MSRRAAGALVALAAAILLFALWRAWAPPRAATTREASAPTAELLEPLELEQRPATLWLPAARGRIAPLEIELESATDRRARLRTLLDALVRAQPEAPLTRLFTEPVEIAAAVLGADRVLYVDLRAVAGGGPPPAGATLELQRVYSIVHTVLHDDPSLSGVVLLWNGVQRSSFSGHVDTTQPLGLRPQLEER